MSDELPTREEALEEAARRSAFNDQMHARHTGDAEMLGNMRRALIEQGFSDGGAEKIVEGWYVDFLAFSHHLELFSGDEEEEDGSV